MDGTEDEGAGCSTCPPLLSEPASDVGRRGVAGPLIGFWNACEPGVAGDATLPGESAALHFMTRFVPRDDDEAPMPAPTARPLAWDRTGACSDAWLPPVATLATTGALPCTAVKTGTREDVVNDADGPKSPTKRDER